MATLKLSAATLSVGFVAMSVVNALVTSQNSLVKFTNTEIANTHPVYGLPAGYAFSVWGIIYLLEGIFVVWQLVPAKYGGGFEDAAVGSIRPLVLALFGCNATWLVLFGWELNWIALLVIVLYDALLFQVLSVLKTNYFLPTTSWKAKLFCAAGFSANASWVTVASLLQTQVNLLEEGWMPSADFVAGELMLAVAVACVFVYRGADVLYAIVAAWALGGIIANQADDSDWGCNTLICPACDAGLPICSRANTSTFAGRPNGFAPPVLSCQDYEVGVTARTCVVAKSALVANVAALGIALVAAALVAGVIRALIERWTATKSGDADVTRPQLEQRLSKGLSSEKTEMVQP